MNVFSQGFARGIMQRLIDGGHVKVASDAEAEKIADAVGARLNIDVTAGRVPIEATAEVATEILKQASATGALVTGDKPHQANTPENAAAQAGGTAKMEQDNRPEGKYNEGRGNTKLDATAGEVGKEQPHGGSPKDDKNNMLNEGSKKASLNELIRKIAGTGALVTGDKPHQANTPENAAAQTGGTAQMEQERRPEGQYNEGRGNTTQPQGGVVGLEVAQTENIGAEVPVNNMLTDDVAKSAAFVELFKETAQAVVPQLPNSLSEEEKVAAVKDCMTKSASERKNYIAELVKKASNGISNEEMLQRLHNLLNK